MISLRKAQDRGHFNHGWLDTYHTFSFADYYDPGQMGFSVLRVINEDTVAPGKGFATHGHRDMEIITYVLDGALEHKDSLGSGSVIRPGEVQRMSAGSGITHSEFNHSTTEPVHFLQIWILPDRKDLPPDYEQKFFALRERHSRWRLVASPDGDKGSVTIRQNALVYVTALNDSESVKHRLTPGRSAYLQLARGRATVNGVALTAGDGARISDETEIDLTSQQSAEALLFDLP
jgi:redox-sensitive bicupin YhaK (pirin superfamily)